MRGIIKAEAKPGLVFREDLPLPVIGSDEVLFKVKVAAICGTDVHIDHWDEWSQKRIKPPMVIGHEVCGVVVNVGEDVRNVQIGDRIAVETHIPCYDCDLCRMGLAHICSHQEIYGCTIPGAFAEFSKVRSDVCVKLPDEITDEMGAMMEAMGAGIHGLMKAEVKDKVVLINGCGPIGLMVIGASKVHGAKTIIATDIFDGKLDIARQMGADFIWNSNEMNMTEEALKLTGGLGVDVAIDYSGYGPAIINSLQSVRKGGRLVLVGLPNGQVPINLTEDLIYKEIEVFGISGREMYRTWDEVKKIMAHPDFSIDPVIGGRYPLEDFREAFNRIASGVHGKMLLYPDKTTLSGR